MKYFCILALLCLVCFSNLCYADRDSEIEKQLVFAKQGDVSSMNRLGVLYRMGLYHDDRFKNAVFWFEKAVSQGSTDAIYNLGKLYEEGYGYERNYVTAFEFYSRAAREQNTKAMYALSGAYRFGRGTTKDVIKANSLLRQCSELGNDNCKIYLNFFN